MVKTNGCLVPTNTDLIREFPSNLNMLSDIINSCWGACIDPDPNDASAKSFVADAIISNPVTYAHIHCAEALGSTFSLSIINIIIIIIISVRCTATLDVSTTMGSYQSFSSSVIMP